MNTANVQNDLSPLVGLQDSLGNRKAYRADEYTLEWGVRTDDNALILHVYPPLVEQEQGDPVVGDWTSTKVGDSIQDALEQLFDTQRLTAGFQSEENSFYVIAGGYGGVLNVRGLVERFQQLVGPSLAHEDATDPS